MAPTRRQGVCRLVLVLGVGLAGCRTKPESGDTGPIPRPESTSAKAPDAPPPGCDELGPVLLSVEPPLLSLTCKDRHHECSGRTTLTVRSCAARALEFHEVMIDPAPPLRPPVVSFGGVVRLEPGDTWTMELELEHLGIYELSLGPVAMSSDGPAIRLGTATLTVDNPAREQAMAACHECNGDWGRHGMLGIEGCNCRTRDGGTPCDDGADCQAQCIARVPETEFRCSEFVSVWGCHHYLPVGWSKQRRGKGVEAHYMCVD